MWLTALASALPGLAKVAQDVIGHDDKAATAAKVAADPSAPADVKAAAANVASKAIDDSARAQKDAIGAVAGKGKSSATGDGSSVVVIGLVVLGAFLLKGRR